MELNSEHKINAPRDAVFAALNNPDILRQCIPGCESLEKVSDTEMSATVALKVGPVKAKFKGRVELSNLVPPETYTISGQGSGGGAGFAKGSADIRLVEEGNATLMQYAVKADVGGRLAQLGERLTESTAKSLSEKFFDRLCEIMENAEQAEQPPATAVHGARAAPNSATTWIWIGAGAAAIAAVAALIVSTAR